MKSFAVRFAVLILPIALAGCDALGLGGNSNVSVSFAVPAPAASAVSADFVAADPITLNGHTLDLQNVDVTFSKIELDRHSDPVLSDDDNEADDDAADHEDEEEIEVGTTTVALPLAGGVITPLDQALPPGDYESIEMKIASVRLRGTYDGQAFDVVVPVHGEIETEFEPPFHIASDADRLNITVQVDVSQWLRVNGALVDPRQLATNETLQYQVAHQIKASFHSFEDNDRHGDDDHDEHDGGED